MATMAAEIRGAGIFERAIPQAKTRTRNLRPVPARQDRDDSPLLHPNAAEALVMAAAPLEDGPRPIALVLEDGTVQSLQPASASNGRLANGTLSGRDWTLWWERRNWAKA